MTAGVVEAIRGVDVQLQPREAAKLAAMRPLLERLNDLKRVRVAGRDGSLMDQAFTRTWSRVVGGGAWGDIAWNEAARAVAAVRLAGLDVETMQAHGLSRAEAVGVAAAAIDLAVDELGPGLTSRLKEHLDPSAAEGNSWRAPGDPPAFIAALVAQPRAGATHPTARRMVLEPAESHGDHCMMVAIVATLLSDVFDADQGEAMLIGLAHHLFNASLPDVGFAGDRVLHALGLDRRLTQAAFDRALQQLDAPLRERVRGVLAYTRQTDPPLSRCFHGADALDRVLEMAWHDRAARFRLNQAMTELNIVHEAPEQAWQRRVLEATGVWDRWEDPA